MNSPFPLNDGGLFFTMTQELIVNGFRLPMFSSYNQLQIPYVYPPLSFYLTGLLSIAFDWNLLDIFRFMPVVFSLLAILAFFFLVRTIEKDEVVTGLSVLIFSLLPSAFEWLIMGGGITRAPAFFFSLLAIRSMYLLFTRKKSLDIFLTAIFSALTILFHPEAAIHTLAAALVFFIVFGRNKSGFLRSIAVIAYTMIFTSPWWLTIITRHGFKPFLTAGSTGFYNLSSYISFFTFNLTNESGVSSIAVLGLLGLFIYLSQKKLLFPFWLMATFLIEPRSAPLHISTPLTVMAATTLISITRNFDKRCKDIRGPNGEISPFQSFISKSLLVLLLIQWNISAISKAVEVISESTIKQADLDAIAWVKANTDEDSSFLILTGLRPFRDPVSEWFPALSQRSSIATVQGYEWKSDINFDEVLLNSNALQKCLFQDLECIASWLKQTNSNYDYVIIRKFSASLVNQDGFETDLLKQIIKNYPPHLMAFTNDEISIYRNSGLP